MNGDVTGIYRLFNCTHFTILIAASSPGNKQAKNLQEELNNMSRLPVTVHMLDKETYGKVFFDVYGVKNEAVFVVRPDSHVGFRSSEIDAVEIKEYFETISIKSSEKM